MLPGKRGKRIAGFGFLNRFGRIKAPNSLRPKRFWERPKGELKAKKEELKEEAPSLDKIDTKAIRRKQLNEVDEEIRYQIFLKESGISKLPLGIQKKYQYAIDNLFRMKTRIDSNELGKVALKEKKKEYDKTIKELNEEARKR